MSRTRFFGLLKKAMTQANFANANGWLPNEVSERLSEKVSNVSFAKDGEKNSRRDFLKAGAVLALATQMPMKSFAQAAFRLPASKLDPVLILGGGAAGLAAAYTLKKAGVPFRLLEASARTSGRINTQSNFNGEGQFIERGAELIDTSHAALIGLAKELGLEIEDFSDGDKGFAAELWFFQGKLRTQAELVAGLMPLVKAVRAAKSQITGPISFRHVSRNPGASKWDKLSLGDFLKSLKGQGEDWILEAVAVAYTGEMGRHVDEQTSLNLITMMDTEPQDGFHLFGDSDESKRIKGGNMRLTTALYEAITSSEGGKELIEVGAKVVAIREQGSKIVVSIDRNGVITDEVASQVICTIPFSVLREVDGLAQLGLRKEKLQAIRTMGYGQNSKVMLEFSKRAWREQSPKTPASTGALYGDFASQAFWETSRLQSGNGGIITNFLGGAAGVNADRATIFVALDDLGKVHEGLPQLFVKGVVQNWNLVPTMKGSYTCFMPGQMTRFGGVMGEAELKGRLLFAGEHASEQFVGFMNGAFETGIGAAEEIVRARRIYTPKKAV